MTQPSVERCVAKWRKAINAAWQKQVDAIVATGQLLIRAHADLIEEHGAWQNLVENELPFSRSTATKLMEIARHSVLSNGSNWNRLPASWTTLYELSRVPASTLSRLIEEGEVNSRTGIRDATRVRGEANDDTSETERVVTALHRALTRFYAEVSDLLSGRTLTDDELALVMSAIREMNEVRIDIERRVRDVQSQPLHSQPPLEVIDEEAMS